MQPSAVADFPSTPKSAVFTNDGGLIVLDNDSTVSVFSRGGTLVDRYKLSLFSDGFGPIADISPNAKSLVGVSPNGTIAIWSLEAKSSLGFFENKGEASILKYDESGNKFAMITLDGRIYLYGPKVNGLNIGSVGSEEIAVSAAFSPSDSWLACATLDGLLHIIDVSNPGRAVRATTPGRNAQSIYFLDETKLLVYDEKRTLSLLRVDSIKFEVSGVRTHKEMIAAQRFSGKELFLTVSSDGTFSALSTLDLSTITQNRMQIKGQATLAVLTKTLKQIALFGSKKLYIFDLETIQEEFKRHLQKQEFEAAYRTLHENSWLNILDADKSLQFQYEHIVSQAMALVEKGNNEQAKQLLEKFSKTPNAAAAKEMIQSLQQFGNFVQLCKNRRYANAYQLAENNKMFKESSYYKAMEQEWERALQDAKKLLSDNKDDGAKMLLSKFQGITEKQMIINEMLLQKNALNLFIRKLNTRDFKSFFELARLYPFLQQLQEYKDAITLGQRALKEMLLFLREGDMVKAAKYLEILRHFPMYKTQVQAVEQRLNIYSKFFMLAKNGRTDEALMLEKKYDFLGETKIFKEQDAKWRQALSTASALAKSGDIAKSKKAFGDFLTFRSKAQEIAMVLLDGYIMQLFDTMNACAKRGIKPTDFPYLETSVENLINIYGRQEPIVEFLKEAKKVMGRPLSTGYAKAGDISKVDPSTLPDEM